MEIRDHFIEGNRILPLYKHTGHKVRTTDWFCETCSAPIEIEEPLEIPHIPPPPWEDPILKADSE